MQHPLKFSLFVMCLMTASIAVAKPPFFSATGFRLNADDEQNFTLDGFEIFGTTKATYSQQISKNFAVKLNFETAIGLLTGEDQTASYVRFAPVLALDLAGSPISLTLSSGPTLISEHTFGNLELGGMLQFTSSLGVDVAINEAWTLGYRYNHTSNAHIYVPNPGFNMHSLSIAHKF